MNIQYWKYCPYCGLQEFIVKENGFLCRACDHVYYENISATVVAILTMPDGRVVMSERGEDPAKGKLDFPGGFVSTGETIESAIVRELMEELKFVIDITKLSYLGTVHTVNPFKNMENDIVDVVYSYQITDEDFSNLSAQDDVASVRLVDPRNVTREDVSFDEIIDIIKLLQK